jgi:hypothetical protein
MLDKTKMLSAYKLRSLDGEIGKVKDFYFDDCHWAIRYLVADTGDWLADRLVLISPHSLMEIDKKQRCIAINLTKKQIEASPSWNSDKPVIPATRGRLLRVFWLADLLERLIYVGALFSSSA